MTYPPQTNFEHDRLITKNTEELGMRWSSTKNGEPQKLNLKLLTLRRECRKEVMDWTSAGLCVLGACLDIFTRKLKLSGVKKECGSVSARIWNTSIGNWKRRTKNSSRILKGWRKFMNMKIAKL